MMKYDVEVVHDCELPRGVLRVIVERPGGDALLLLAESAAGTWLFMQKWAAAHASTAEVYELRPAG